MLKVQLILDAEAFQPGEYAKCAIVLGDIGLPGLPVTREQLVLHTISLLYGDEPLPAEIIQRLTAKLTVAEVLKQAISEKNAADETPAPTKPNVKVEPTIERTTKKSSPQTKRDVIRVLVLRLAAHKDVPVSEIREELQRTEPKLAKHLGANISSFIAQSLTDLVKNGELKRAGTRGKFRYRVTAKTELNGMHVHKTPLAVSGA